MRNQGNTVFIDNPKCPTDIGIFQTFAKLTYQNISNEYPFKI